MQQWFHTNQPAFVLGVHVQVKTSHTCYGIGVLNVFESCQHINSVIKLCVLDRTFYKRSLRFRVWAGRSICLCITVLENWILLYLVLYVIFQYGYSHLYFPWKLDDYAHLRTLPSWHNSYLTEHNIRKLLSQLAHYIVFAYIFFFLCLSRLQILPKILPKIVFEVVSCCNSFTSKSFRHTVRVWYSLHLCWSLSQGITKIIQNKADKLQRLVNGSANQGRPGSFSSGDESFADHFLSLYSACFYLMSCYFYSIWESLIQVSFCAVGLYVSKDS